LDYSSPPPSLGVEDFSAEPFEVLLELEPERCFLLLEELLLLLPPVSVSEADSSLVCRLGEA
jgi:hypothetical protein